jgi:hypothetical protein
MIEATISSWLGGLSTPLYPLAIPADKEAPSIVYRIESEFTPDDGNAPYGAFGHRIRLSVWHPSYKSASEIIGEIRTILNFKHAGFLVSVEDRGDYQDADTELYGIVLDVEITTLKPVIEAQQRDIRGAVKTLLLNNEAFNNNVYATRVGFANSGNFPNIGISIQSVDIVTGNSDQDISVDLVLNIKALSTIDSENQLEQLVKQVEYVLHPDFKLADIARINLKRISTSYSSVGRLHYEHRVMAFDLDYYSPIPSIENLPDIKNMPDLSLSGALWNIDSDTDPEAEDLLSFPN